MTSPFPWCVVRKKISLSCNNRIMHFPVQIYIIRVSFYYNRAIFHDILQDCS